MTKLTVKQRASHQRQKRRLQLIEIVKENYAIFNKSRLACGKALIELRDDEHWRETHTTFEEFCNEVFKISDKYAYKLIQGVKLIENLPEKLQAKITNEAQTRALAQIPETNRIKAIKEAEKNGGITAENLTAAADKIKQNQLNGNSPIGDNRGSVKSGSKSSLNGEHPDEHATKKLELYLDEIGTPITKEALVYWKRKNEIQELLNCVSKIKCAVEKAKDADDLLYAHVTNGIIMDLGPIREHLKEAMPYAVCTTCAGNPSAYGSGCFFCRNRGVISKHQWDTHVPKEVKALRIKQNEEIAKSL